MRCNYCVIWNGGIFNERCIYSATICQQPFGLGAVSSANAKTQEPNDSRCLSHEILRSWRLATV